MGFIYTDDGTGEKEECDFQDESADTEHSVITRDEVERTKAALLLLSPALQDAVNLVCLCGYSCAEAARILQINPGTVRARVYQARKKIRELMEAEENV